MELPDGGLLGGRPGTYRDEQDDVVNGFDGNWYAGDGDCCCGTKVIEGGYSHVIGKY